MWHDRPLYFHFLDRELSETLRVQLSQQKLEMILKCLMLATTSKCYSALSTGWENPSLTSDVNDFFLLLVQLNILDLVSNHPTVDEFLASRETLYRHDAARYPMYFDRAVRDQRLLLRPTLLKQSSATLELAGHLGQWAATISASEEGMEAEAKRAVLKALSHREDEAITATFFEREIPAQNVRATGLIRREISRGYTSHYADFGSADIPTGIHEFVEFDHLARDFPNYDVAICEAFLAKCGFKGILETPWKQEEPLWTRIAEWRGDPRHWLFRIELSNLLTALARVFSRRTAEQFSIRHSILSTLSAACARVPESGSADFEGAAFFVRTVISVLRRNLDFSLTLDEIMAERQLRSCDVLIVVATSIERDAVLSLAKSITGTTHQPLFGQRRTYYDLGFLGGAHLVMVQTEMGSIRPGGSLSTISDAIDDLKTNKVILVGIAFGVDEDEQTLSTVLVSQQLVPYELQRVGTKKDGTPEIMLRGDKPSASTMLLGRFRAATASWRGKEVEFGAMLSGEKLVDNVDFRGQLEALAPEAIGGEMEGAGLYAAAHERAAEWIIVKAICDWADGNKRVNKSRRQRRAADEAVRFVLHTIHLGGFV
jgi:nucleoside phosphorylase